MHLGDQDGTEERGARAPNLSQSAHGLDRKKGCVRSCLVASLRVAVEAAQGERWQQESPLQKVKGKIKTMGHTSDW